MEFFWIWKMTEAFNVKLSRASCPRASKITKFMDGSQRPKFDVCGWIVLTLTLGWLGEVCEWNWFLFSLHICKEMLTGMKIFVVSRLPVDSLVKVDKIGVRLISTRRTPACGMENEIFEPWQKCASPNHHLNSNNPSASTPWSTRPPTLRNQAISSSTLYPKQSP